MSGDDDAPAWGPARRVLAAEVAEQVLLHGRSRIAVGTELGLSRFQVARLLDAALERGLVRVDIDPGADVDARRSSAVRAAHGLRRALVARDDGGVPALAAALLAETVGTGDVLGLAWSRTVNDVVGLLPRLARCTVVQLCGAYSLPWRRDGSATAVFRAAALCGGDAYPVYAPLLLPDADTARAVRAQPGVADALARCAALDTAVVGIGAWRAGHSTVHDVLTAPERRRLAAGGAVGEVVGLLVDRAGRVLDSGPAHQLVAAGEADLRAAGDVIALVRDPERADATRAVLRSGLVHTLVCDAATADALLAPGDGRHPPGGPEVPAPASTPWCSPDVGLDLGGHVPPRHRLGAVCAGEPGLGGWPQPRCTSRTGGTSTAYRSQPVVEDVAAPARYVHCTFTEVPPGSVSVAGEPMEGPRMVGLIHDGRSPEVRARLLHGIADAWCAVTGDAKSDGAIFLHEVPRANVLEDGEILPEAADDPVAAHA